MVNFGLVELALVVTNYAFLKETSNIISVDVISDCRAAIKLKLRALQQKGMSKYVADVFLEVN